jgi:hypothetical protein
MMCHEREVTLIVLCLCCWVLCLWLAVFVFSLMFFAACVKGMKKRNALFRDCVYEDRGRQS